jgi:G3E family GTPase
MAGGHGLTPVTVLTGFLGSGKTTLLNQLVRSPIAADSALIINELGDVAIDHALVREASETMAVLDSGCICCTVANDLVRTLRDLYFKRSKGEVPAFRRVIIETTGLADPAPILHTLIQLPVVVARYSLAGVATTVDAEQGRATLARHREALRQVAMADRLIMTKVDRVGRPAVDDLRQELSSINPGAALHEAIAGAVPAQALLEGGVYQLDGRSERVREWLRAEAYRPVRATRTAIGKPDLAPVPRHNDRIQSFVIDFHHALDFLALEEGIEFVLARYGDAILRMKGIVAVTSDPQPRVVHAVAHTYYPPGRLPAWPSGWEPQRTSLVFIVEDVAPALIEASLKAFVPDPTSSH